MRKFVIVPVRPASSALSVLLLILAGLVGATGAVADAADAGCEIMPASVDFGDVTLGNVAFELVVVRNVGDVVLHLDPSSDHPSFVPSLDTNDLAPGEQAVLEIRFQPFLPIVSQSGTIDLGPGARRSRSSVAASPSPASISSASTGTTSSASPMAKWAWCPRSCPAIWC